MKPSKYRELLVILGAHTPIAALIGSMVSLIDFGFGVILFGAVLGYLTFDPLCKWYGRWFR